MRKLFLGILLMTLSGSLFAKDGYRIKVEFKQAIPDNYVYLAHYYAKSFPTVYKTDSAKVINSRTAIFNNKDSVLGGIYMVIYKNNSKITELLLENGDEFSVTIDTASGPGNTVFQNSPVNESYVAYQKFLIDYGSHRQSLANKYQTAKNKKDSAKIDKEVDKMAKELTDYRKDYLKSNPKTLMAALFRALAIPEVPEGTHYQADGKTVDSNYAYFYYKNHYWDGFDFQDNRLINSPIYDSRLNEYFNRVLMQIPDTITHEADKLLAKSRGASEIFKYTLHWITGNAEKSKVMGMDEVFVYLVEKYYMHGDAFWLDSTQLSKYEERARKIAPNVLGNPAPDLKMQDIWTLQDKPLNTIQAPYTVVIFWSPKCGACQAEVPKLDSVYENGLKQKGVVIYSIPTEGNLSDIQEFIKKEKIDKWINVVDAHNNTGFRDKYDVYGTPKIYLLDKDKVIIGKNIDHSNVLDIVEFNEKIEKKKS